MEEDNVVAFKSIKKRNIRQRKNSSSADEDEELTTKVEKHKEIRKLREKQKGVSAFSLAIGKKAPAEELVNDSFMSKKGGMVDMELLKKSVPTDDAYEIGTQFSKETNTRDEDAEMLKYIESELQKRKKEKKEEVNDNKFLSPEEAAILALPEYLRKSSSNKSEEMLSNQMLSGIPEVDLGIEVKINNIEATEEAKQKILMERMKQKEGPSQFVPSNMAVNFVQHNRFNIEEPVARNKIQYKKKEPEKRKVVVVGSQPELEAHGSKSDKEKGDKATDDFHFEKFKKQFRRF